MLKDSVLSVLEDNKGFDAVKFAREQKDRLSAKFAKMAKEEIVDYLKQKFETKNKFRLWRKSRCVIVCNLSYTWDVAI